MKKDKKKPEEANELLIFEGDTPPAKKSTLNNLLYQFKKFRPEDSSDSSTPSESHASDSTLSHPPYSVSPDGTRSIRHLQTSVESLLDSGNYGLLSKTIDKISWSTDVKKEFYDDLRELQEVQLEYQKTMYDRLKLKELVIKKQAIKKQFLNNLAIISKETGSTNAILRFLDDEMKLPDFP